MKLVLFCIATLLQIVTVLADIQVVVVVNLKTTDGQEFHNAYPRRLVGRTVAVNHSKGATTLSLDVIPDEIRKTWGLPSHTQIEDEDKAQRALIEQQRMFEEEQRAKGLVLYQDKWLSAEELVSTKAKERTDALVREYTEYKEITTGLRRRYLETLESQRKYLKNLLVSLPAFVREVDKRMEVQESVDSVLAIYAKSVTRWRRLLDDNDELGTKQRRSEVSAAEEDLQSSIESMKQRRITLKEMEETVQKAIELGQKEEQQREVTAIMQRQAQRQALAAERQAIAIERQADAQEQQADAQRQMVSVQQQQASIQQQQASALQRAADAQQQQALTQQLQLWMQEDTKYERQKRAMEREMRNVPRSIQWRY